MTMCNKKTAGMKGEERNKAQSECMKARRIATNELPNTAG